MLIEAEAFLSGPLLRVVVGSGTQDKILALDEYLLQSLVGAMEQVVKLLQAVRLCCSVTFDRLHLNLGERDLAQLVALGSLVAFTPRLEYVRKVCVLIIRQQPRPLPRILILVILGDDSQKSEHEYIYYAK